MGARFLFAGRLQKKDIYGVGKLYFSCNSIVGLYFKRLFKQFGKSYLVELKKFEENAIYDLQKILPDNFLRNVYI